jgi:hypothetical protein
VNLLPYFHWQNEKAGHSGEYILAQREMYQVLMIVDAGVWYHHTSGGVSDDLLIDPLMHQNCSFTKVSRGNK